MRAMAFRHVAGALSKADPRYYQIIALGSLLIYGVGWMEFDTAPPQICVILTSAVLGQLACTRLWKLPSFEPKSALISGLSLCLLLRTNSLPLAALASSIAIFSKFLFRCDRKHIFNPTNFALVVMLLVAGRSAWISPGQWGAAAWFAFLLACMGGFVVNRALRGDVTLSFLGFYSAILFGRSWWLNEPMAIPLHRIENGALLLFAFFMISDPKTTPESRTGRILFSLLVALGAAFVQFKLFRQNGLLWSLVAVSPLVPLLNRLLPGQAYSWQRMTHRRIQLPKITLPQQKGTEYEPALH